MPTRPWVSYRVTLTTLSPVVISSGEAALRSGEDFVVHAGRVWVLDRVRAASALLDDAVLARPGPLALQLDTMLQPADLPRFARRTVALRAVASELREIVPLLRDSEGRAYIPGSSLKGALRTALGWERLGQPGHELSDRDFPLLRGQTGHARQADDSVELRLWSPGAGGARGRGPTYDVFRALRIADSAPLPADGDAVYTVVIATRRGPGLDIAGRVGQRLAVEAIQPVQRLQTRVVLDEGIVAQPALGLTDFAQGWFGPTRICQRLNARAQRLIARELAWLQALDPPPRRPIEFYRFLQQRSLRPTEALLTLGWGRVGGRRRGTTALRATRGGRNSTTAWGSAARLAAKRGSR